MEAGLTAGPAAHDDRAPWRRGWGHGWNRRWRIGAALVVVSLVGLTASACDPCSGIVSCETTGHVQATGQLVERESGDPVEGVELIFTRSGGVELETNRARVVTDGNGRFVYRSAAMDTGTVQLDVEVLPPGWTPYRVDTVELATQSIRGDGADLGRWVVDPYFAFIGELRMRYEGGPPRLVDRVGARVIFRPTGGVETERDIFQTRSDAAGRFFIDPAVPGPGRIVGDLTVRHPDLAEAYTIEDLVIESDHVDRPIDLDAVLGVGPSLLYVGVMYIRSAGGRIPSSAGSATFRRTGGIRVSPDTFTSTTADWGGFSLDTQPLEEGVVIGELILRPEGDRSPDTIPEIRMETFNADSIRRLDEWTVGEQINYAAALVFEASGEPVVGAEVEFRRTGGIGASPESFTVTTDSSGNFLLRTHTDEEGTLEGELLVRAPGSSETILIPGLNLETFASDELRFLQTFEI